MPDDKYTITISTSQFDKSGKANQRIYVDQMLNRRHLTLTGVVKLLKESFPDDATTTQNISNKLARGSLRDYEIAQIANVCGFSLVLIDDVSKDYKQVKSNHTQTLTDKISSFLSEGYEIINGVNYDKIIIVGKRAADAGKHFTEKIKEKQDITPIIEFAFCKVIEDEFGVIMQPFNI